MPGERESDITIEIWPNKKIKKKEERERGRLEIIVVKICALHTKCQ